MTLFRIHYIHQRNVKLGVFSANASMNSDSSYQQGHLEEMSSCPKWKSRKSPGSLKRCLSSKHLSCTSPWLVYLRACQAQLRKLEVPRKPDGPGQPRVARITKADDLACTVHLQTNRGRPERWLNTIQWAPWWANMEAHTKKSVADSMERENQEFTVEGLLQPGLEGWIGVHQLRREG